jgi:hypothetical protein
MPIKDQCDNCKNFNPNNRCLISDNIIDYNELTCSDYDSLSKINLNKNISSQEEKDLNSENEMGVNRNTQINGWLSFFLFSISLGGILTLIQAFTTFNISNYEIGGGVLVTYIGVVTDVLFTSGLLIFCTYTLYSFLNYKRNSVGIGKLYLILLFFSNILALYGGMESGFEENSFFGSSTQIARSLIFSVIWFLYLMLSKQVNEVFPKQNRVVYKRDKILFGLIILIPILYLSFVLLFSFISEKNKQSNVFTGIELNANEYSDGRIAFEKPDGFVVEKMVDGNDLFYRLTQGESISMTIYSTFDTKDTKEYFEECMSTWADTTFVDFEYNIEEEKNYSQNNNSIYLKTLEYNSEPILKWSFAVLFNKETGKCCVISCYSRNEVGFLSELIDGIRFK